MTGRNRKGSNTAFMQSFLTWSRNLVNLLLGVFKWPIAVLALLALPFVFMETVNSVAQTLHADFLWFWLVCVGFACFGWATASRFHVVRHLVTIEHEFIHTLFAWLTFHRVGSLSVKSEGSGHMTYEGPGNWLISLSPYFVPLAPALLVAVVQALRLPGETEHLVLGAFFGYWVMAHRQQNLHADQTDFAKTGYVFSLCLLPTAMLLSYGALLVYVVHGGKAEFARAHLAGTGAAVREGIFLLGSGMYRGALWVYEAAFSAGAQAG